MKIVLSIDEVGQILANYLYTTGKIEKGAVNLTWQVDKFKLEDSYVEIKR